MKEIHFNLKPNDLTFGKDINEELRSISENFQDVAEVALTAQELAAIQGAEEPAALNPFATVNELRPYKCYSVKLNQSGELPPTAIILEDSTVSGVALLRISAGKFHLVSGNHEFVQNRTTPEVKETEFKKGVGYITAEWVDDETIEIMTYGPDDAELATPVDGILIKQLIYIEIYK